MPLAAAVVLADEVAAEPLVAAEVAPVAAVVAAAVAAAAVVVVESAALAALVVVAVAVVVGILVVVTGSGVVTVDLPLSERPAWRRAPNKSCKKACRSCGRELALPLLPVGGAPELVAVAVALVAPVVPVVLPSVVVAPEVPVAGLASTNCVRAESNALKSLPPWVDPLVPVVVRPESEPSSRCRPREAR